MKDVIQTLKDTKRKLYLDTQDTVTAINNLTREGVECLTEHKKNTRNVMRLTTYYNCMTEYILERPRIEEREGKTWKSNLYLNFYATHLKNLASKN